MSVSIGILARNEAPRIARTLRSLFAQSVFHAPAAAPWELVVVANGCTDETAAVARGALQERPRALDARVIELAQPGKSNAWNRYVHELSRRDAAVIVMLDADIEFGHADTLRNSLAELASNRAADVVVDQPLNSIARKPQKSLLERLRLRLARQWNEGPPAIAGSFYCARATVLRAIWMPAGLPAEDGFLTSMVTTDLLRARGDARKVARAKDATHYYEATAGISRTFRHELRIAVGTALNCYLLWDFLAHATDPRGPGAGELIRSRLAQDPDWYRKFIDGEIASRGWWVLPRGMLFRRFAALRDGPLAGRLARLPSVLALFAFDLAVCVAANNRLKKHAAVGYW
jgi:glycosyltransferase involved in cell wall biosynthesis